MNNLALVALVSASSFNPNFQALWPESLNAILADSYADPSSACSGSQTANCVVTISNMLTRLTANLASVSGLLGTSGSMTNWFIARQGPGATGRSILQENLNYVTTVMTALKTLISGDSSSLTSLLSSSQYANFQTAVANAKTALITLSTDSPNLKTLVSTLTKPFTDKVGTVPASVSDKATSLIEDVSYLIEMIESGVEYLDGQSDTVQANYLRGVGNLAKTQGAYHDAVMDRILEITSNVTQDLGTISNWNEEKARLVSDVNNAIMLATRGLPDAEKDELQTTLDSYWNTLTTTIVNPAQLGFATITSNYQKTANDDVGIIAGGANDVIRAYQAMIDGNVSAVSEVSQYFKDQIAGIAANTTITANDTLSDINSQMLIANSSQSGWQAIIRGHLNNIAQSLLGVHSASVAYEATSKSLAKSVLQKFNDMIGSVTKAALEAGKIATIAVESSGDPPSGGGNIYDSGTSEASSGTSDQVTAVSTSTVNMMGSLADLLLSLQTLVELMHAKMDSSTDSSTGALELVNKVASGNAQDLAQTIGDISAKQQANLIQAQATGMDTASDSSSTVGGMVSSVGAATFQAVNGAQNLYADAEGASNEQISDMAALIEASSEAGSNLQNAHSSLSSAATSTLGIMNANATALRGLLRNANAGMQVALDGAAAAAMSELDNLNSSLFWQLQSTATQTNLTVLDQIKDFQAYLSTINKTTVELPMANISATGVTSLAQLGPAIIQAVASFKSENDALNEGFKANRTSHVNHFSYNVSTAQSTDVGTVDALVALMGNATRVTNIADVQAASAANFSAAVESAYDLLGNLSSIQGDERGLGILAGGLNDTMMQLRSDVNSSLTNATTRERTETPVALEILRNKTELGLNATKALNSLILSTQSALNALNTSVRSQIVDSTTAIDLNPVLDKLNQFLAAVVIQQSKYFDLTSHQAALRAAIVTDQQADLHLLSAEQKTELIAVKADYASRQSNVLGVADQLTKTIGKLASSSGTDVSSLLASLSSIRGISDGLSSSLQSYVSGAASRMESETKLAAQQLDKLATGNVMTRSLAAAAIGNKMVDHILNFNASTQTISHIASYNKGGLVGVSQIVQDLSTAQSLQLQMLLNQVEAGKVTLQQALASAVNISAADLTNIGEVASAFAGLVYEYTAVTAQTYSDADAALDNFKASATDTIKEYGAALNESLASVTSLVTLGQKVSRDLTGDFESAIDSARGNLTIAMRQDSQEAIAVGNTTSFITGLINNATSRFSEIDAAETAAVNSLTKWAQVSLHNMLATVSNPGTAMSIDSKNLQWSAN